MNKNNITGWQDVFSFTLVQTLKSKAFIISYVIFLTLAVISIPILNIVTQSGETDANAPSPVKKVYVQNETTLPHMNFSELKKDAALSHIVFEALQEDYEAVEERIEEEEKDSVILILSESQDMFSLNFVKASGGPVKDISLYHLSDAVVEQFENFRITTLGITAQQIAMVTAAVDTKVTMTDINGAEIKKEDTSISGREYWFIYGILFIILMVNVMASTQIATAVVTEKSTRVIEYLLTSVKPLALMIGKILAMLTAVLLQMISMLVILALSNNISSRLFSGNGESSLMDQLPKDIFMNLNIVNIVLCLILIALGMIFYATLAALAGATVSRLEEINEGLALFTITNLVGAYIGLGAANILMGSGENAFVTFALIFPLSSPFILPGSILVGKASLPMAGAAILLQILFIALLFRFVAKVYETLILHNGNTIKMKELFKLSKTV
jgi:ABC-2 type transport system permease protein